MTTLPSCELQSNCPSYLLENYPTQLNQAVTQGSRLIAWSWSSSFAFADPHNLGQEVILKKYFVKALKTQGINNGAYVFYGNEEAKRVADLWSDNIKNLLLGDHDQLKPKNNAIEKHSITLTLGRVLEELSGEQFVFTEDKTFTNLFTFRVSLDTFIGNLYECSGSGDNDFITTICFPPIPSLNIHNITEQQLDNWARKKSSDGSSDDNYLPPTYIPVFSS